MNTEPKQDYKTLVKKGLVAIGLNLASTVTRFVVYVSGSITLYMLFFSQVGGCAHKAGNSITSISSAYENVMAVPQLKSDIAYVASSSRATADVTKTAIFQCDTNGLCFYVNDALAKLFGGAKVDFSGEDWAQFIIWTDRERVQNHWARSIRSSSVFKINYSLTNGKNVEVKAYPVRSPINNIILFWNGTVEEVSDRQLSMNHESVEINYE